MSGRLATAPGSLKGFKRVSTLVHDRHKRWMARRCWPGTMALKRVEVRHAALGQDASTGFRYHETIVQPRLNNTPKTVSAAYAASSVADLAKPEIPEHRRKPGRPSETGVRRPHYSRSPDPGTPTRSCNKPLMRSPKRQQRMPTRTTATSLPSRAMADGECFSGHRQNDSAMKRGVSFGARRRRSYRRPGAGVPRPSYGRWAGGKQDHGV